MSLLYILKQQLLDALQQEQELALHSKRSLFMLASCSQEAKAAAKKAKVEKSAARQQAAAAEKPAGSSKKAKAKQEAEEKRVRCSPEQLCTAERSYGGCFAFLLRGNFTQALHK